MRKKNEYWRTPTKSVLPYNWDVTAAFVKEAENQYESQHGFQHRHQFVGTYRFCGSPPILVLLSHCRAVSKVSNMCSRLKLNAIICAYCKCVMIFFTSGIWYLSVVSKNMVTSAEIGWSSTGYSRINRSLRYSRMGLNGRHVSSQISPMREKIPIIIWKNSEIRFFHADHACAKFQRPAYITFFPKCVPFWCLRSFSMVASYGFTGIFVRF